MPDLRQKLRRDGIVEALFEIRFNTSEIAELFTGKIAGGLGRIADDLTVQRLPMADIPGPMRRADANLMFQPTLQLSSTTRLGRIGDRVISWHILPPYPGWNVVKPEIQQVRDVLASSIENVEVLRYGFRYINLLDNEDHHVPGLSASTLTLTVGGQAIPEQWNVNYLRESKRAWMTVKLASKEFVQGATPRPFDLIIDLDANTDRKACPPLAEAVDWAQEAHTLMEDEFFRLLKPEILQYLREV
jgi:uncharacterized protein (TIGR04255 family)